MLPPIIYVVLFIHPSIHLFASGNMAHITETMKKDRQKRTVQKVTAQRS